MYLEMLQQRYGAELEKQAMEKQALNPMQLVQMGRRFVGRGKMDRFERLIAKRNKAVDNVIRDRVLDKVARQPGAFKELKWQGDISGPVHTAYRRALRRSPGTDAGYINRRISDDPTYAISLLRENRTMGRVDPDTLADWSEFLRSVDL